MPTACYNDLRFIGNAKEMREVAALCFDCPFVQECGELGLGEKEGVYGGMLPTEEIRRAHRKSNDVNANCRNGHPKELYAVEIDAASQKPIIGCTYCAKLQREIAFRA